MALRFMINTRQRAESLLNNSFRALIHQKYHIGKIDKKQAQNSNPPRLLVGNFISKGTSLSLKNQQCKYL
jgi:hypothetical protein